MIVETVGHSPERGTTAVRTPARGTTADADPSPPNPQQPQVILLPEPRALTPRGGCMVIGFMSDTDGATLARWLGRDRAA